MENQKLMLSYLGAGKKAPLKTIQPTADSRNGSPKIVPLKKMIHKTDRKPLKIFEDKKRVFQEMWTQTEKKQNLETSTQTEGTIDDQADQQSHNDSGIDQEAYDLMVKDPIPESYWKELAEERRLSLAEALSENEMLHQSMEELKEENLNLSQLASQAEYLASVLNSVVEDEDTDLEKKTEDSSEVVEKDSDEETKTEVSGSKCDSDINDDNTEKDDNSESPNESEKTTSELIKTDDEKDETKQGVQIK